MAFADDILLNPDFLAIAEVPGLTLGAIWESIWVIDFNQERTYNIGDLDGMVDIGLVAANGTWAITAREKILLWRTGECTAIERDDLACVEEIQLAGPDHVKLSVDTNNMNGNRSEWIFGIHDLSLGRLS